MKERFLKIWSSFNAKSLRERVLVAGAVVVSIVWVSLEGLSSMSGFLSSRDDSFQTRKDQVALLQEALDRYRRLSTRSSVVERNYAQSQLTTEQVYEEVEKAIKETLQTEGYELRPVGSISDVGDSLEQQGYSLKIPQLSLSQMVKLLHKLEQGEAPLFMGKLELSKVSQQGMFSAVIDLSSLRKKR